MNSLLCIIVLQAWLHCHDPWSPISTHSVSTRWLHDALRGQCPMPSNEFPPEDNITSVAFHNFISSTTRFWEESRCVPNNILAVSLGDRLTTTFGANNLLQIHKHHNLNSSKFLSPFSALDFQCFSSGCEYYQPFNGIGMSRPDGRLMKYQRVHTRLTTSLIVLSILPCEITINTIGTTWMWWLSNWTWRWMPA